MMEHKHADLLRMAADNADQLFECDDNDYKGLYTIYSVINNPDFNWRPVKTEPKKIKLLAYMFCGQLLWFEDTKFVGNTAIRVPSEDKEFEVVR